MHFSVYGLLLSMQIVLAVALLLCSFPLAPGFPASMSLVFESTGFGILVSGYCRLDLIGF